MYSNKSKGAQSETEKAISADRTGTKQPLFLAKVEYWGASHITYDIFPKYFQWVKCGKKLKPKKSVSRIPGQSNREKRNKVNQKG